jgi:hypothetical protein
MTSDPRQIGTGPPGTPPHLDENAEEGLTSCNVQQGQNKNFGSKKSHFHFKNRELFLQNIELTI